MQDYIARVFAIVRIRHVVLKNFAVDTHQRLTILILAIALGIMLDGIAGKCRIDGQTLKRTP